MVKTLVVAAALGIATIVSIGVGCVGGDSPRCFAAGQVVAITRTNGSGDCPADVVAGILAVNQTPTLAKGASCGVVHFNFNLTFTDQTGSGASCQGSDMISFQDLGSDGTGGTGVMTITCANGTDCTENFDDTFTPQ